MLYIQSRLHFYIQHGIKVIRIYKVILFSLPFSENKKIEFVQWILMALLANLICYHSNSVQGFQTHLIF